MPTDGACVCSLTALVDDMLRDIAPRGVEGERVRRHVLRAEREIRRLVAEGARGTLSDLWARAAPRPRRTRARSSLTVDGDLADCDHELPRRVVAHAWHSVQREKARRFHADVDRLVQALSDILRAAFIHSEAGHRPESLQAAFGPVHSDQFDFEKMSRLLGKGAPKDELPPDRRERIEWALEVLRRQRFFDPAPGTALASQPSLRSSTATAAARSRRRAFRERLPDVVEFVKAMSIAELEADGRYVSSHHDAFFQSFDENSLSREDLARFPDYLVYVDADESGAVIECCPRAFRSRCSSRPRSFSPRSTSASTCGARSSRARRRADGRVRLQATSSSLYQLRERLLAGSAYRDRR